MKENNEKTRVTTVKSDLTERLKFYFMCKNFINCRNLFLRFRLSIFQFYGSSHWLVLSVSITPPFIENNERKLSHRPFVECAILPIFTRRRSKNWWCRVREREGERQKAPSSSAARAVFGIVFHYEQVLRWKWMYYITIINYDFLIKSILDRSQMRRHGTMLLYF